MNLLKPEYIFRPKQIIGRLSFSQSDELIRLPLPWSNSILARTSDNIGRAIATHGLYDLTLSEALFRLTEPRDLAFDIGANIGYTAAAFALAAGRGGQVIAFEPNPDTLPTLQQNVESWRKLPIAPITIQEVALSDHHGVGILSVLEENNSGSATLNGDGRGTSVPIRRLDDLNLPTPQIIKIDVEGHEVSVFCGAQRLLKSKSKPRDIIFEEQEPYPAVSHRFLQDCGYQIHLLTRNMFRPLLADPTSNPYPRYMPSNYLATIDLDRAERLFRKSGWLCLSKNPFPAEQYGHNSR